MEIKQAFQWLITIAIVSTLSFLSYYSYKVQSSIPQDSVCRRSDLLYTDKCDDVGKHAYMAVVGHSIDYGEIVGVAWRSEGTTLYHIGTKRLTAPRDGYYYIISKDGGKTTIMQLVTDIEAR